MSLSDGQTDITYHTLIHEDFKVLLEGFPSNAHPMGVLSSLVTALTAFYPDSIDPVRSADEVRISIVRFTSQSFLHLQHGHIRMKSDNRWFIRKTTLIIARISSE